ncbi:PHB depolymerase family esterase [Massilia sp. ST3]|uniref:extracellular catalytic domain type 1 short-chain-length polyhydroxyalkanoate depolymerase n=1 Tax=Massilia sp. ST3 TaxID=2824903 RepID=UPI001B82FF84|nr:PHB depolymerase family esterase [Massilia sp. ST3]MBQ5946627.1 PHB depolymerase family esterase [Massilia sp. ST3]
MKPLDRFISQMVESARLAQTQDASAATALIQKALAESGLLPQGGLPQAPMAPAAPFVDLNQAPGWRAGTSRRHGRGAVHAPHPSRHRANADAQAPGRFVGGSFSCAAGARRYKLYIPARPAQGPRPLVVMLHGCTQNPDDFATGTAMNALAEEHGCLVLYPEQDKGANHNGCWNWFEPAHQGRERGEPAILAGMTRQVIGEHGGDPARVYAAGLSAGGAMAAILGADYPELYAAVGIHSGLPAGSAKDMMSGLKAMREPGKGRKLRQGVPAIVFHGDADHLVNPGNGEAVLAQFLRAQGAELQQHTEAHDHAGRRCTRHTWRDSAGRSVVEHWQLHGAGHAWSGGNPAGSHTDAAGPSASAEMLRFFLSHHG